MSQPGLKLPGSASFVARIAVVGTCGRLGGNALSPADWQGFRLCSGELASSKCDGCFASASALLGRPGGRRSLGDANQP